jgi:hypothetical protein
MRKILIIIIALVMLIAGLFTGCTQDSNKGSDHSEDTNYIIGGWVNITNSINVTGVNVSFMRTYNFTNNNKFNYSYHATAGSDRYYAYAEGTYELKDGNLIVTNSTTVPPKKATLKYSFSSNYKNLTLISESGLRLVYTRLF